MSLRGAPLWLRWLLTLAAFGAAAIVLLAVLGDSGESPGGAAAALLKANAQERRAVIHDQAPHSSPLPPGAPPSITLEGAIAADVRNRVRRKELGGPARGVQCTATNSGRVGRRPYRCTALAGAVAYPFLAVVDLRTHRLTWCKFDQIPAGEGAVPLSPRCRG